MVEKKLHSVEEYKNWLKEHHKVLNLQKYPPYYYYVTNSFKNQIEENPIWTLLSSSLTTFYDEYRNIHHRDLFSDRKIFPKLTIKNYDSFIEKTYRKNYLLNDKWPDAPKSYGWVLPENWFSKIKDILRTRIIVKYLDGLKFLLGRIENFCNEHEISYEYHWDARFEGYYAINSYFNKINVNLLDPHSGEIAETKISVEIQITTQIQEVMKDLLHFEYEKSRILERPNSSWKWDYNDDNFSITYLAHLLHFAEGKIMEITEKKERKEQ